MDGYNIYKDIAARTRGDIYIGVVGPMRTGKSTFIRSFMTNVVIPNIEDSYARKRATDELPQAGNGTAVMTTEPKFIPNEAVKISTDNTQLRVKMIDCVGYATEGVSGFSEDNAPRMVNTPWAVADMPFSKAAEMGTRKVIAEHSTIAVIVTTDGTVTDLDRDSYIEAERRSVAELKEAGKPFVMLLNSSVPEDKATKELEQELAREYDCPVMAVDCREVSASMAEEILDNELKRFPVEQVNINLPKWVDTLPEAHPLRLSLAESAKELCESLGGLDSAEESAGCLEENENVKKCFVDNIDSSAGVVDIELTLEEELFYNILSETTGMPIGGEYDLISTVKSLSQANREYDKIKYALLDVQRTGYGVVTPPIGDMELEKPELMKQGNRYGIALKATAPTIHLIRADVTTSVAPIVGNEEQSKELVAYLNSRYSLNKEDIWSYNIFGRTMGELINDDLSSKLARLPEDTQNKFRQTVEKILNEGSGGIICILL